MNVDNRWEAQLEELGKELAGRPRLAPRVLQEIANNFSDGKVVARNAVRRLNRRRYLGRAAAGLGFIVASVAIVLWGLHGSGSLAFAQVQAALRDIKTAVIVSEYPDAPAHNHRVLVSSAYDLFRVEAASGAVLIQSRSGKKLMLNTKLRTATVTAGAGFGLHGEGKSPRDLLSDLQNVQINAVKQLGTKVVDGKELTGFELPSGYDTRRTMWVDRSSHLPVKEELRPIASDEPADAQRAATATRTPVNVLYQFNIELSHDLFSLEPPEDYTLVDAGDFELPGMELPGRPKDYQETDYVIVPGQGIGRARFGMTTREVISIFGQPDSTEQFGGFTAEQQRAMDAMERRAKAENWDRYRVNREMNRIVNSVSTFTRAGEGLFYRSLGFWLRVHDESGLQEIICSPKTGVFQMFGGMTSRNISINSTLADVKREYGQPLSDMQAGESTIVVFDQEGLIFTFGNDGRMKEIRCIAVSQNDRDGK